MAVGIFFVAFAGYGFVRIYYRNMESLQNKDPPEIAGTDFLKYVREIATLAATIIIICVHLQLNN